MKPTTESINPSKPTTQLGVINQSSGDRGRELAMTLTPLAPLAAGKATVCAVLRALQVKLMFPLRCCTQTMLAPTTLVEATPAEDAPTMLEATLVDPRPNRADPIFAQEAQEIVDELLSGEYRALVNVLLEKIKEDLYQKACNKLKCKRQREKKGQRTVPPAMPFTSAFSPGI